MTNLNEINKYGREASFIANVIFTQHSNRNKKLSGLLNLLRSGKSVITPSFSLEFILVDGEKFQFSQLENF